MTSSIVDRIRDALGYVPAHSRETWLRMGMAVKSELGESGFTIWNEWSRQDDAYNAADAKTVWRSIKPTGGVSIGTLFHDARDNGWRDDGAVSTPVRGLGTQRGRHSQIADAGDDAIRALTAAHAAELWHAGAAARPDHPYLVRKQLRPVENLRELSAADVMTVLGYAPRSGGYTLTGQILLVPVYIEEQLSTLELIDSDGRKAALAGRGTKAGGVWPVHPLPKSLAEGEILLIGEGMATVLSAFEATGAPAVAALSNTNLAVVAQRMRAHYAKASIVILADLLKTSVSPDSLAVVAACEIGARLALPDFGSTRPAGAKDFNDMARISGKDAVAHAIQNSQTAVAGNAKQETRDAKPSGRSTSVELICASGIKPVPVDWLWDGYLAAGKLALLAGSPGTGKTTIAMKIAATITTGGKWPDGSRPKMGNVVIWSGEDEPTDTLVPRLMMAGADRDRVQIIQGVAKDGRRQPFDPSSDIACLSAAISENKDVRLVIFDPIVSAVAGDSHKNAEVRRSLQPIVDLATDNHCALLGITHFSKGTAGRDPVERLNGSLAFGAVARIVLIATQPTNNGETASKRMLVRAKSNLGPDGDGFEYDFALGPLAGHPGITASMVAWGRPVAGSARALLAKAETASHGSEQSELTEAKQFLLELLADGPVRAKKVQTEATGAGHTVATLRRARKALKIKPRKAGMSEGWFWELPRRCSPDTEDAPANGVSAFEDFEHLQHEQH